MRKFGIYIFLHASLYAGTELICRETSLAEVANTVLQLDKVYESQEQLDGMLIAAGETLTKDQQAAAYTYLYMETQDRVYQERLSAGKSSQEATADTQTYMANYDDVYKARVSAGSSTYDADVAANHYATAYMDVYDQTIAEGKSPNNAQATATHYATVYLTSYNEMRSQGASEQYSADYATARMKGLAPEFANQYANLITIRGFSPQEAYSYAFAMSKGENFLNNFVAMMQRDHSVEFALAYAQAKQHGHSDTYAGAYAESKEQDHSDYYASIYASRIDKKYSPIYAGAYALLIEQGMNAELADDAATTADDNDVYLLVIERGGSHAQANEYVKNYEEQKSHGWIYALNYAEARMQGHTTEYASQYATLMEQGYTAEDAIAHMNKLSQGVSVGIAPPDASEKIQSTTQAPQNSSSPNASPPAANTVLISNVSTINQNIGMASNTSPTPPIVVPHSM